MNYAQGMAKYFNGFRFRNLGGSSVSVAEGIARECRKINSGLIITADLSSSSDQQVASYTRRIGIDASTVLMKSNLSGQKYIDFFHKTMGNEGQYTGSLNQEFVDNNQPIEYLQRRKPLNLTYDLTQSETSYEQDGNAVLKTPVSWLIDNAGGFVGSTQGYDQLGGSSQSSNVTRTVRKKIVF